MPGRERVGERRQNNVNSDTQFGSAEVKPAQLPNSTRWLILFCTCGGLFGQFFAFDIPSSLNEELKDFLMKPTNITEEDYAFYFSSLYSVYSLPNIILPLAMGIAVDIYGYRMLIALLAIFVVGGHVVFSTGVLVSSWPIMLAGRALFGFGGESLQVAQNAMLFRWFKGKEVAFALGLNLSVAGVGSVLNDILSPWAAQEWGIAGALKLGTALVLFGLVCNVIGVLIDKTEGSRLALPDVSDDEHKVSIKTVLRMPRLYWLLATLSVIIYCSILPFNNIASAFFVETRYANEKQADAELHAGRAMSLLFLVAAVATPPFGSVVDRIGMRAHFLLASSILVTICYALIYTVSPMVTMFALGVVFTGFAGALWPSFALTVPQNQLGTAYGVAITMQNCGLSSVPMLVGHLQAIGGTGNFLQVIQLFFLFGVFGIVVSLMICHTNMVTNGTLNLSSNEAEKMQEREVREGTSLGGSKKL